MHLPRPFISQGFLQPRYHKFYWMGLTTSNWPQFLNINPVAQNLSLPNSYKNWGRPRDAPNEPNNMFAPENCGGGNASLTSLNAWGWADYMCSAQYTYMCRWVLHGPPAGCMCSVSDIEGCDASGACVHQRMRPHGKRGETQSQQQAVASPLTL